MPPRRRRRQNAWRIASSACRIARARGRSSRAGSPRDRRRPGGRSLVPDAAAPAACRRARSLRWNPPRTRFAPSFHHSGSASSNSQRRSAAASLTTSRIWLPSIDVASGNGCPGVRQSSFAALARRALWSQQAPAAGSLVAGSVCHSKLLAFFSFYTVRTASAAQAAARRL